MKAAISFALTFYVVAVALAYFAQEHLIFPAPDFEIGSIQDDNFEQVAIPTPDGERLFAFHHPAQNDEATILVFHGNADAAVYQKAKGTTLVKEGFGVLLVEYRGYPGSTGSPSEAGLYADGIAAYDFAARKNSQRIGIYAHSLGTGVAVKLATEREVYSLVLESPFDSVMALAQRQFPWMPVSLLLKHKFRSDLLINQVQAPILMIHGEEDRVIPIEHGRRLHRKAAPGAEFEMIENAGHNNLAEFGTIRRAINYLKRHLNR